MKRSDNVLSLVPPRKNGRPRKDPGQKLPKRVYLRSGSFFYVHASSGKWENLGKDLRAATCVADAYNKSTTVSGTMDHWFDEWEKELDALVKAEYLAPRTRDDYKKNLEYLRPFFGRMHPKHVETAHVQEYLDIGRDEERPVRANREVAALSSCMTWLVSRSKAGMKLNPCKNAKKNSETKRTRYITDDEYKKVHKSGTAIVRAWSEIIYRTLQRPGDVLKWTKSKNIVVENDVTYLSFKQGKTGAPVRIVVSSQLQEIFDRIAADRKAKKVESDLLLPNEQGKEYTMGGISTLWQRAVTEAGVEDFGIYDCKSKGATDMFQDGVPIETIQHLCAHDSVTTTEIYVKARIVKPVQINSRQLELDHEPRVDKRFKKKAA